MHRLLLILLLFCVPPAWAAFPVEDPAEDLVLIKAMIENGEPEKALKALRPLTDKPELTADVQNLLGYAYRKLGRFDESRTHYVRALTADPKHKGALEYMGELELQVGNVAAARVLLARLRGVCETGCPELDDLIEAFDKKGLSTD